MGLFSQAPHLGGLPHASRVPFRGSSWLTDKKGGVPSRTPQIGLYSLWDNRFPRRVNMEGTPRLYDTLVQVLSQHQNWVDRRHLKTLACMVAGLIQAGKISLTAWVPYVHSRAVYAQSTV